MNSLHKILGITWRDKVPHTEVLKITGCVSLESTLNRNLLRWLGHVVRMDDTGGRIHQIAHFGIIYRNIEI